MEGHGRPPSESIVLLRRIADGDPAAEADLYATCYAELRARAGAIMGRSPAGTLQATALVHEAWLRLSPLTGSFEDRRHFLRTATRAMRCVLVDFARARVADKRGGGARREDLRDDAASEDGPSWRMVALGDALEELEREDPQTARVVHLRVFAGLGHAEIAELLGVTVRTVERHWAAGRAALSEVL